MVKVKFSIVLMLLIASLITFSQDANLSEREQDIKTSLDDLDRNRSATLESGRRFSGYGIVHFVEGDSIKGEIAFIDAFRITVKGKKYSPQSVDSFSFYDYLNSRKRSFIALEYDDRRSGINDFFFFEVLFEFKSFALLEKIDPVEDFKYSPRKNSPVLDPGSHPIFDPPSDPKDATYEHIYVFDSDGNTEPYLQTRYLEPVYLRDEMKSKIIRDKLLFAHLEPQLKDLKKFAKENKLSFEKKDDFLKIMEHYRELTK